MIKIVRTEKPKQLTDILVREKTLEFKNKGKKVWGYPWLKRALLEMSHYKCAYCEKHLDLEDSYMEVEHFKPKSIYEDDVLKWENLLPACKRCNSSKNEWDTNKDFIVNPTEINPKDHLTMKTYRYIGRTKLGKNTIICLNLNDDKIKDQTRFLTLIVKRFEIGNDIINKLETIHNTLKNANTLVDKMNILNKLKSLLYEAVPTAEYAATCATTIFSEKAGIEYYKKIKSFLENNKLWNGELQELEDISKSICLC